MRLDGYYRGGEAVNDHELNQVLELTRDALGAEASRMVSEVYLDDFTAQELIAFNAILRPVWERAQQPAPVYKLELVKAGGTS